MRKSLPSAVALCALLLTGCGAAQADRPDTASTSAPSVGPTTSSVTDTTTTDPVAASEAAVPTAAPPEYPTRTSEPLRAEEAAPYKALVQGSGFIPIRIERIDSGSTPMIDGYYEDRTTGTGLAFTLHLGEKAAGQIRAWEEDVPQGEVPGGPGYEPVEVRGGTAMTRVTEWAVDMRVRSDDGSHVAYVTVQETGPTGSLPQSSVDFVREVFVPQLLGVSV